MTFFKLKIGKDDIDRRLDRVIRKLFSETSMSIIYKNIRSGFIRVNNKKVKNEYRLQNNDCIFVEMKLYEQCTYHLEKKEINKDSFFDVNLDIVYVNEHILILNKPFGVNVQASSKDDVSLDRIIREQYKEKQHIGQQEMSLSFLPGPMHRLDKNTSGLIAFSQSLMGARYFSDAIKNHKIVKNYLCILQGQIKRKCTWEHSIRKASKNEYGFHTVAVSDKDQGDTSIAITRVYPIVSGEYEGEEITLANIIIETGKTHQIRSQASFTGTPLLGDVAYGYKGNAKAMYLHAWQLEFEKDNPINVPHKLIADLPTSFKNIIKQYLSDYDISSYNIRV